MSDINAKDLPVTISFAVGQTQIPLSDLLSLAEGAVIEGEAVNSYFPKVRAMMGDRFIAEGELVKIDDKVAFRVTKVV